MNNNLTIKEMLIATIALGIFSALYFLILTNLSKENLAFLCLAEPIFCYIIHKSSLGKMI